MAKQFTFEQKAFVTLTISAENEIEARKKFDNMVGFAEITFENNGAYPESVTGRSLSLDDGEALLVDDIEDDTITVRNIPI